MNRSSRYVVIGLGVTLLFWCCVAIVGLGLAWSTITQDIVSIVESQPTEGTTLSLGDRAPAADG